MPPTRFPSGLSTAKKNSLFGDFIFPDMTQAHVYWNDFDYFRAAEWDITGSGGGTNALLDIDGGALGIVTGATAGNRNDLEKIGDSFLFQLGKKIWFETRVKIDVISTSDYIIGLRNQGETDGVYFQNFNGTNIHFTLEKNSATTKLDLGLPLVDDTFIRLSYFYNGKDAFSIFINGALLTTQRDLTNFVDDAVLTTKFFLETTSGFSRTMTLDYIFAAKER